MKKDSAKDSANEKKSAFNRPFLRGKWNELKGKARKKWGEAADNDVDRIKGRKDQLVGIIQQKYGMARRQAWDLVEGWERQHGLS